MEQINSKRLQNKQTSQTNKTIENINNQTNQPSKQNTNRKTTSVKNIAWLLALTV